MFSKSRIAVFFLIILIILGLFHFVIYETVITVFGITSTNALVATRVIFVCLAVSFLAASILSNFYRNVVVRTFYKITAVWIGFAVITFIASAVYGVLYLLTNQWLSAAALLCINQIIFCIGIIAGIYGIIHANRMLITRIIIKLPHLPRSWQGSKAVLISDIHLGHVHGRAFAEKVVQKINEFKPDIVFIPGDLFDGVNVDEADVVAPFASLKPPRGVYFATGNHEEFRDSAHFLKAIRAVGIHILVNEAVTVDGVEIIGVNDRDSVKKDSFAHLLGHIVSDADSNSDASNQQRMPRILMKHQPSLLDEVEKAGISLQLSGHTHLGQMWPFGLIARVVFHGYEYGLKSHSALQVYTSSGVGTWGPPFRIGTRSEIVEMTFMDSINK